MFTVRKSQSVDDSKLILIALYLRKTLFHSMVSFRRALCGRWISRRRTRCRHVLLVYSCNTINYYSQCIVLILPQRLGKLPGGETFKTRWFQISDWESGLSVRPKLKKTLKISVFSFRRKTSKFKSGSDNWQVQVHIGRKSKSKKTGPESKSWTRVLRLWPVTSSLK